MFEASQDAARGRFVGSRKAEENWDFILQAADVKSIDNVGEGMTLLEGMTRNDVELSESRWILIGKPKIRPSEDLNKSSMGIGVSVGIKKPTWDLVFSDGDQWQVGVEWTVMADRKRESESQADI